MAADEQGARPNQGEALPYTTEAIRSTLGTLIVGRRIELHRQVGSTNDLAREAGRNGEPEGLVVLAEEQVRGRGRLGRAWVAPPGCCILCSVLLRPRFPATNAFYLTIAASLAIHRTCRRLGAQGVRQPAIKWPNDVLLNGKKVAGILSESEFAGSDWAFAVVGFGINVNLRPEEIGTVQTPATSLLTEWGQELDRARVLAQVLGELESLYLTLQNGQFGGVFSEWAGALETVGRQVSVREDGGVLVGHAVRVEADGALVVRQAGGIERRVLAGDVAL